MVDTCARESEQSPSSNRSAALECYLELIHEEPERAEPKSGNQRRNSCISAHSVQRSLIQLSGSAANFSVWGNFFIIRSLESVIRKTPHVRTGFMRRVIGSSRML